MSNSREMTVARKFVKAAIAAGYTVSVHDGEEWPVKRSVHINTICDALNSTGIDTLRLRDKAGEKVGTALLVWGNAPDGSELFADYSDNAVMRSLIED